MNASALDSLKIYLTKLILSQCRQSSPVIWIDSNRAVFCVLLETFDSTFAVGHNYDTTYSDGETILWDYVYLNDGGHYNMETGA